MFSSFGQSFIRLTFKDELVQAGLPNLNMYKFWGRQFTPITNSDLHLRYNFIEIYSFGLLKTIVLLILKLF